MTGPIQFSRSTGSPTEIDLALSASICTNCVVDRALDVDAAVGRALLATEAECAAHDALGRLVEVRALADDGRVLAAHLDDDRLREALGELLVEVEANLERAGEEDAVDAVVLLELGADRLARARRPC